MKGRTLWIILVSVLLVLALSSASPIVYRLLFALFAVPLVGYLSSVLAARAIQAEVRRMTPYLQVGEMMEEQVTVQSLHWWPKLLLEVEQRTSPFKLPGRIVSLWPYGTATWSTRTRCAHRGIYHYGVIVITSRDPMGLFARSATIGEPQTALIYPATIDLSGFFVPSGQGFSEGMVRGRTFMPSAVASSVRDYTPGDAYSHIHWQTTARHGKLMIKEFDHEPSGPSEAIWVVLDLWDQVQAGEGIESTVEYGVTIAASIAKRFLDTGRTVGLIVGGDEQHVVKPDTGPAQLGRVLQALAMVQAGPNGPVHRTAQTLTDDLLPKASVVLISPAPVEEVAAAGELLKSRGASVVRILLEAGSFRGEAPAGGDRYHTTGADTDVYVIHRGDEIERRLDHRIQGAGTPMPEPMLGARP